MDKASEKNVEFECFEPYNKTELNLSICSGVNINIYVKLKLSEETKALSEQLKELGYNMFDINDAFYQDICTPYKSLVDSDILLTDRIYYIYNNKDSQCKKNCEFINYFSNSRYINCSCHIKKETNYESKKIDKFESKTIYESFYNVLKYSNYEIFQCYQLVFANSVMIKNKGSIIIISFFCFYLGCLITYFIKGLNPLKAMMKNVVEEKDIKMNLFFPPQNKRNSVLQKKESNKKLSIIKRGSKRQSSKSQYQFLIFNKTIKKRSSKKFLRKILQILLVIKIC